MTGIRPTALLPAARTAAFLAAYLALDWASYIHPLHGFNITPWSPAPALGLVWLCRGGRAALVALFAALLAAEILVRRLPAPLLPTVVLAGLLTAGYWVMARLLLRRFPDGQPFAERSGLAAWAAILAAGTLANGLAFISALALLDLIPGAAWGEAVVRFWVGDAVGLLVTMPLVWLAAWPAGRRRLRQDLAHRDSLVTLALGLGSFAVAFGLGAAEHFQYFYVLFLPVAWAAARQGLAGAAAAAVAVQVGVVVAVQQLAYHTITVLELQMLALALAMVGFFVGIVVDEQRRAALELRESLRLAAAGEMAAALAHELNQPLTALAAYGKAVEHLARSRGLEPALGDAVARMLAEAGRAADVVRRLRDFFRTGATRLAHFPAAPWIEAVAAPWRERAAREGIDFRLGPLADAPLYADRLQLEVALRNLLSNAFEAVVAQPAGERRVELAARRDGGWLALTVADSGPGLAQEMAGRLFEPFRSTKASGMGLGLAMSRAIAEAHGGRLEAGRGGEFVLTLPIDEMPDHGRG